MASERHEKTVKKNNSKNFGVPVNTEGKCQANQEDCPHEDKPNRKFFCSVCGCGVHPIFPCGKKLQDGCICTVCFETTEYDRLPRGSPSNQEAEKQPRSDDDESEDEEDNVEEVMPPSLPAEEIPLPSDPLLPEEEEAEAEDVVPKVTKRGKSYTSTEDILVTKAWVVVSADSRNGVSQKREVFAKKLKEAYDKLVAEHNRLCVRHSGRLLPRDQASIMSRWSNQIRPSCSKWAGVCKAGTLPQTVCL